MKGYYKNIDEFWIYNWDKCCEGNLTFCRIDNDKGSEEEDINAWDLICQSYLTEFGFTDKNKTVIDLKTEIATLQCDLVITGNRFLLNKIERLQDRLLSMIKEGKNADLDKKVINMGRWAGYRMTSKDTTVRDFFNHDDLMNEEYEEIKKQKKANGSR